MTTQRILDSSVITAIKTPFKPNGEIDLDTYDKLVDAQIAAGCDGLVVGGTTGEGHLLNWEEHLMLIAHSVSKYGDKLVIIGNTGSNNTREAIKATEYGFASGMHASLQINPYYGKTTPAGVETHIGKTLQIGPAIVYNVESRTGQDISKDVMQKLAEHENFIGVKECSGNERISFYESRGIACWSGNDDEAFLGRHEYGSHGVISVTSNLVPKLMVQLMNEKDEELNKRLLPLFAWLFCEPNPISINTALSMTGAIEPVFRLPYLPLSMEKREEGIAILEKLSSREIIGSELNLLDDADFKIVV
ncbi:4-hydroxy-tetrahydrodipicolinate synthase [Aliikangiella sp. G2MR2-5]|uniref:4-hydroxy-tetrahydrodipicolinate synthase n=1 Tax=Aliikangiella sp. G2MR2-5 TaxID=2788943 RepID=UPI0018AA2AAC|nr:4-hydroxy-tetrahydrodipicolinate synthase [Aliikangiella sp. G2MR2-5]